MSAIKTVGVLSSEEGDVPIEILSALANSCGLNVRRARLDEAGSLAGFIMLGTITPRRPTQTSGDRPSIRIIPSEAASTAAEIRFGTGPASPPPFRGRSLLSGSAFRSGAEEAPGEVVATAEGQPVWTTTCEGVLRNDRCWVPRPWIKKGECVFDHLNGSRFMSLLPLLEWLRWVSDWREWEQPPLRACFMFDDPNLHGRRYGFVGFDHLAAEGRAHRYHTAFATVPLDGYYVNPAAARIFRQNGETLSLLTHGNNHTCRELAGRQSPREQLGLMRQAVLRTCRLEQKAGVAVSRVMAPPHGVTSVGMMAAMTDAGFEAACISHGSARAGSPGADWTVSLGVQPISVVAGLPVIPRFRLDRKPENHVLLAAYLNQPVIPVGHHWDLADGTDILSSAARFINGLGKVTWSNMSAIARSNYRFRVRGQVMRVQTFSRVMAVNVPERVSELELEAPWVDPTREHLECSGSGRGAQPPPQGQPSTGFQLCVTPGSRADIVVVPAHANGEQPIPLPGTPWRAVARKLLVELRDRSMPYLPRNWARR